MNSQPRLQKITNLSDDGQTESTHHQLIVDGEVLTFPQIKSSINSLLSSSSESDQKVTAVCMHAGELMARIESGEKGLADTLARVVCRIDALQAVKL